MKVSFKLLLLVLGAGVMTLQSCTEEEEDTKPDAAPVITCYPTTVTESSDGETTTTNYVYNDANQLIGSTYTDGSFSDVSTYTYSADGRLATVTTDTEVSSFIYTDADDIPERINTTEDGEPTFFSVLTTINGNITKIENSFYEDGEAILSDVSNLTYTNGVLTGAITENYDPETETFETELELRDFVYDGKKNPFNGNIAFAFDQEFNPLVLSTQNLVSASLIGDLEGQEVIVPYTGSYTYNDNNYPLIGTQGITGFFEANFTYEYDCK